MFKTRKTKIISTPVEEVLEVKEPEPVPEVVVPHEEFVAMDYAVVEGNVQTIYYGTIVDYDGVVYEFEWDLEQERLCRLSGPVLNTLVVGSAREVVRKLLVAEPVSKPVEQSIEERLRATVVPALDNLTKGLSNLETKLDRPVPVVQPVVRQQFESTPVPPQVKRNEEPLNIPDEDFATNALKFLQEDTTVDLGIDYMSL